jgi:alkylhydroperoxidase family enzyme
LTGTDEELTDSEKALARWARQLVRDPNSTGPDDVQALREAGFTDSQIFAVTTFVALRLAFSTINDALGAPPDAGLRASAPAIVVAAVTYGRQPDPA